MATDDRCCTIVPYFKIHPGRMDDFRALCEQLVERAGNEPGCLYYGFSFDGDEVHCREGYVDGAAALAHLENAGDLIERALGMADLSRFEVHGPADEITVLREPLAPLGARLFALEYGFRR